VYQIQSRRNVINRAIFDLSLNPGDGKNYKPICLPLISPLTHSQSFPSPPASVYFLPHLNKKDLFVCPPKRRTMQAHRKRTHLLHSVDSFPFDLVVEVEVALVEVVNSHVSVLSAAGVALARRVGGDSVEGTEVTSHTADLVLENLVVETGLELTLTGGGSCDIHGCLTTTEDDKILLGGDGGTVEGCIGNVSLEDLEVTGRDELGGLVLASSDEVGTIGRPLEIDDRLVELVDGDVVEQVASLGVVSAYAAILMAGDDVFAKGAPASNGGLALVANDGKALLVVLLGVEVGVDVDNNNVGKVTHSLLSNSQQLGSILVELDSLDGGRELPGLDEAAGLDFPETDSVVGRTGGDHG
jgi:hypothetical protein